MTRRRLALPASLAGAAVAGAVVTVAVRGGAPAPAATAPPPLTTAAVVRTTLVASVLTAGTLGYAPTRPLVNQLTGTYTWLPRPGAGIAVGAALYRVDNAPVVLLRGRTPAWRPFALGMTGGPDVRQLQANLIALGYATGLLTAPTGHFDLATADAVARWQAANGYPATGTIGLGQVVFFPAAVRAGAANVAPGQAASPGQAPCQVTTAHRVVMVPLTPNLPPVRAGERVTIVLPSLATTPGKVTAIGSPPPGTATPPSHTTSPLVITVRPGRPRATGTGSDVAVQVSLPSQTARGVLAVPVTALLALAGGGYGVEVVTGSGEHRLTGVRTGLFAGGQVAISGPGIGPGTRVVVAE